MARIELDTSSLAALDELSIKRRAKAFTELLVHEGWNHLTDLARTARDERIKVILSPTETNDEVLRREYIKGVAYGIEFILDLPMRSIELSKHLNDGEKNARGTDESEPDLFGRAPSSDERAEFESLGPKSRVTSDDNERAE